MKTYDCFTFFNELELLDLRLNVLNDVVDYFVIVESNKTFSYKDKPLFYLENKELFSKYEDKIIHIIVDDLPTTNNYWYNEYYQRNCISNGLTNCKDDDIIIVSDLDEIPNPIEIEKIKSFMIKDSVYQFNHKLYYYYLNLMVEPKCNRTKLCTYSKFKTTTPQQLRSNDLNNIVIENGGWHFSYVGGVERIKYKIESFAHSELNNDEIKNKVEDNVLNLKSFFNETSFEVVEIDSTYPQYLLDNLTKYDNLILKQTK